VNDKPTPIGDITKSVVKSLSEGRHAKGEKVKALWAEAVGERFTKHAQPGSFKKKRLVVNVDSSSWLYELTIRKGKILNKLKEDLGDEIKELQFRIGELDK
jgi:predicted nucleic acid-binding Zn ribbon protein